ncbi:MAG: DoxX family protein [Sulfuricaulis sp.]|uniref:DoxX family protein n=1 Tax=Sulfuricaulis sp. TaxID=2003553 RepID=UPI0025F80E2F|nr:DoxX family protein [Sulfuricaulis sp.]MCR4348220.1 DoxX family protein [Sulfuricaulis sp.]
MALNQNIIRLAGPVIRGFDSASSLVDLFVRLWVANVFWKSGVASLHDWETTVDLFTYEYKVPLLSPQAAAILGTGAELVFPVLLAVGLATRFSAASLFIFNIIAVISYPSLNEIGLKDHIYWGILLSVTLLHGPGKISIDHFIRRKWMTT